MPFKFPNGETLVQNILQVRRGVGSGDEHLSLLNLCGVGEGTFSEFQRELDQSMHSSVMHHPK